MWQVKSLNLQLPNCLLLLLSSFCSQRFSFTKNSIHPPNVSVIASPQSPTSELLAPALSSTASPSHLRKINHIPFRPSLYHNAPPVALYTIVDEEVKELHVIWDRDEMLRKYQNFIGLEVKWNDNRKANVDH